MSSTNTNARDLARNATAVHVLAALQITLAFILGIMDILSFVVLPLGFSLLASNLLAGIWGGLGHIIGGSMGVHGGKARGRGEDAHCPLIASLVFSVLGGLATLGLFINCCLMATAGTAFAGSDSYFLSYYASSFTKMVAGYLVVYLTLCLVCWGDVAAISMLLRKQVVPKANTTVVYVTTGHVLGQPQYETGHTVHVPQGSYPAPYPAGGQIPAQAPPAYVHQEKN